MLSLWRAAWRLLGLAFVSVVCYLGLVVAAAALGAWRRLRGDGRGTGGLRTTFFHAWSRALVALLGIRVETRGTAPEPPFFLVANHLGYVDVLVLGAHLPCVFVAKSEVRGWPVAGRLCRAVDTVFIDRESKRDIPRVLSRIEEILADGRGVVLFPEGTSSEGASVLPFRPSLLETAARAGLAVSWAALSYRTPAGAPAARLHVCWWGSMSFGEHLLRLVRLPAIEARIDWGDRPIVERDRKRLAEELRNAVEGLFRPVV